MYSVRSRQQADTPKSAHRLRQWSAPSGKFCHAACFGLLLTPSGAPSPFLAACFNRFRGLVPRTPCAHLQAAKNGAPLIFVASPTPQLRSLVLSFSLLLRVPSASEPLPGVPLGFGFLRPRDASQIRSLRHSFAPFGSRGKGAAASFGPSFRAYLRGHPRLVRPLRPWP